MAELGSARLGALAPASSIGGPFSISEEVLVGLLGAADFVAVLALLLATDYSYHHVVMGYSAMSEDVVKVGTLIAILLTTFQYFSSGYTIRSYLDTKSSARKVLVHWMFIFFIIAWIGFLLKITADFSRISLTVSFVVGAIGLVANRIAVSHLLERGIDRGAIAVRKAFLICLGEPEQYGDVHLQSAVNGVRLVGSTVVRPDALESGRFHETCDTVVADLRAAFDRAGFNEIYIFFPWAHWRALGEIRAAMSLFPLPIYLFADNEVRKIVNAPAISIGPLRGFEIQRAPLSQAELLAKRCLDLLVASTALLACAPLLGLTALGILAETGRPVLFRQGRKGFGGRPFTIFKFRTMHCMEDGNRIVQATRNDRRVTRLGAFLRRTSIDELPQLFNVLRGEMSIVGPRPHALAHDNQYDELIATYAFRRDVKPGLTGWAQVHGLRGETSELGQMESRVNHDLWYINNWSWWLDIRIMLRTVRTLWFDRNAY